MALDEQVCLVLRVLAVFTLADVVPFSPSVPANDGKLRIQGVDVVVITDDASSRPD